MSTLRKNNWLPSLFDDMLNRDWLEQKESFHHIGKNVPAVNVKETDDEFKVELAAPGMKKEDFKIELNNDLLTISSEKKEENEETNERFTKREFNYRSFSRSFNLPDSIDTGSISANYVDGVLKVALPKREEAKVQPKRLIEIA